MGLPVIDSYPMPDPSAVPPSGVPWLIDPAQAALLVHDMQNHFVRAFPAGRSPVVELVESIVALRELAGTLGMPVVFSAEPAARRPDQCGLPADIWGPGIGHEPDKYAHLGVLLTAADDFMQDIQPFVVADAVADFSAEEHSMALRWALSGVVCTTDGLLRDLLIGRATPGA